MLRLILRSLLICSLFLAPAVYGADVPPLPVIAPEEVETLTINQLQARSAKGDVKAKAELGARYARGAGVQADMTKAIPLFEEAAKKGEPNGQYYLATAYDMGAGVKKDAAQAAHWFGKAAASNHAGGQYSLAVMMTDGQGGLKADPEAAAALLLKSAEQGFVPAAFQLSQLHIAGIGVEVNAEKAAYWLRRIRKAGEHQAATASLVVLIENRAVTWQPGDPGAGPPPPEVAKSPQATSQAGRAQKADEEIANFSPSNGPNTINTFNLRNVAFETRTRDGYLAIHTTSPKGFFCEVLVDFTYFNKGRGERMQGEYRCHKSRWPAGDKKLICESVHPNYHQMKVRGIRLEKCDDTPAK